MVLVLVARRPNCLLRALVDNHRRNFAEQSFFCTVVHISATNIDSLSISVNEMFDVPPVENEWMCSDAETDC